MKNYYYSTDIREADRIATETLAVPGIVLMENAGRAAAEWMTANEPEARKFLILCGPGNNGGDGFVAARHLYIAGCLPAVVTSIPPDAYKGDAAIAAASLQPLGIQVAYSADLSEEDLRAWVATSDVVVDALLGTGSNGEPRGEVKRLVELCAHGARVVSLDMPSGVAPDTGVVAGAVVHADATVTFLARKIGLAVTPGMLCASRVATVGIGVPGHAVLPDAPAMVGYDRTDITRLAPRVPRDAHKGMRGGLLVVGGSEHFRGAPLLAARAALRAGCGFVFLAVPDFMVEAACAQLPEAIFVPLPSRDGVLRAKRLDRYLAPWIDKCDAAVVGPGLGRAGETQKVFSFFYNEWKKPLLLDADALYHLADESPPEGARRKNLVITPHNGEAARLLGTSAPAVAADRFSSCCALAKRYGNVLLKGPNTLVFGECDKRVVLEGSEALSVPGSGDVLSGAIGAYLAAGLAPPDAATLGALTHALAAERACRCNGLLASDLADNIKIRR